MLWQLIVNGVVIGSVYSLAAVGFGLTYRTCKFINFSYGAIFAVAPYVSYTLLTDQWTSPTWAVVLGLLGGTLLAIICHLLIFNHVRVVPSSALSRLLVSIGLFVAIEGAIALTCGFEGKSFFHGLPAQGFDILGARVTRWQAFIVLISLTVNAIWCFGNASTRLGLLLRGIASEVRLAEIVGVKTDSILLLGVVVSSVLASVAGLLQGYDTGLSPMMGFPILLVAVVAIVIGGESPAMDALAAMLIGITQQVTVWVLPTQWQDAVVFLLLILFLGLRPHGLKGSYSRIAVV